MACKLYRPGSVRACCRRGDGLCFWTDTWAGWGRSPAVGLCLPACCAHQALICTNPSALRMQVGFVSKSGGMSNELYNVIARAADGIIEGARLGWWQEALWRGCVVGPAGCAIARVLTLQASSQPTAGRPVPAAQPYSPNLPCILSCRHRHRRRRVPWLHAVRPLPAVPAHPAGKSIAVGHLGQSVGV